MNSRRIWIGPWTILVAVLHTAFGLMMGAQQLRGVFERGVFNAVGSNPMSGLVVWFLLFGFALALLGLVIGMLERSDQLAHARRLGFGVLALTTLGVVLMPISGFWLMYPVAYGLLRPARQLPPAAP